VLVTPVLLLVTSVKTNLLEATFLKHELRSRNVYTLAFTVLDEQIGQIEIDPNFPITHEEIATLAKQVFTPDWLQQNVEGVMDSFDAWLRAPSGTNLSLTVSLAEPKTSLARNLDVFLTDKLAVLEPCSRNKPEEEQVFCQFAGLSLAEAKEQLKKVGADPDMVTNLLPDTLDLLNPDLSKITGSTDTENPDGQAVKNDEIKKNLERIKEQYQLGERFFWIAWILYGVLAAEFIVLNSTGGWRRLVRWVGALFLCLGLIPAALAIASEPVVRSTVLPHIEIDPKFPAEVAALIPALILDVRAAIFTLPLVVGAVLVVLGLAGLIGGHWIPKPRKPQTDQTKKGPAEVSSRAK
jgi:hypothetical protein